MYVLQLMHNLGIVIGTRSRDFANTINNSRIASQNRRSRSRARSIQNYKKQTQLEENELYEEVEDTFYGPGIAD